MRNLEGGYIVPVEKMPELLKQAHKVAKYLLNILSLRLILSEREKEDDHNWRRVSKGNHRSYRER